ncbi:hypothetical protein OG257_04065 [Streptomyces sp. NBC_00683]|uniref:hypothetical protein n=1 Tax=Streptomyces sp. NBC_00683 TaxID=2903670 RepID=UPI002E31C9D8|nr:hypothetical protein [Streptomyces sp. NBC_00683]
MKNDGIEWLDAELGGEGYALTMVEGMAPEVLAMNLGAQSGALIDPDVTPGALEFFHGPGSSKLPDWAMVGEAGGGWAFALEAPEVGHRDDRLAPGRDLRARHTVVDILDTTMDPPAVTVSVGGRTDWMLREYGTRDVDHPISRRLVAEAGYVSFPHGVYRDDASEDTGMAAVYRIIGEHYGLSLPRASVTGGRVPHVFTEPRVLLHSEARCPACGEERMLPYGGGFRGPEDYRLVCVYYRVRDVPGYPSQGCPGEISAPAVSGVVRAEPNPKYANLRFPGVS